MISILNSQAEILSLIFILNRKTMKKPNRTILLKHPVREIVSKLIVFAKIP